MATVDSSSTDDDVWDAYDDNASYEEDGSRSKALAFITACRILLRRRPESTGRGNLTVSFESVARELDACREWLAANPATTGSGSGSGGRVRFADFDNLRDFS
jgi:hypothetical protein